MDLKIKDLKIGERLIFGKYGVKNDTVYPISWLKCTPNCDFITEYVLDFICFDSNEPSNTIDYRLRGNPDYELSNILSFMNSMDVSWYSPTHESDSPPSIGMNTSMRYENHYGFLYNFEDYEIESIVETTTSDGRNVTSLIRLPSKHNFIGGAGRFDLFNQKGYRARGTVDLITHRNHCDFELTSYIPFWLRDMQNTISATFFGRNCQVGMQAARNGSGLRPVCTIDPETTVTLGEDGHFYIQPRHVVRNVYTNEELFELLGLTRP